MSAGPTRKTEEQLAWDTIKRIARIKVRAEAADQADRRLNDILPDLWEEYQAALSGGTLVALDPEYETWVADAIEGVAREVG